MLQGRLLLVLLLLVLLLRDQAIMERGEGARAVHRRVCHGAIV
jgi:hypothetical protein